MSLKKVIRISFFLKRHKYINKPNTKCLIPRGELKFLVDGLVPNTLFEVNGKLQIFPAEMSTVGLFLMVLQNLHKVLQPVSTYLRTF